MANHQQPLPERCPPELRRQALLTLDEGLPNSLQAVLVDAVQQEARLGLKAFGGLYHLGSKASSPAAVWLQELPGRTGALWPPSFTHPQAGRLLDRAVEHARERQLQLVQFLVADQEKVDESLLTAKGIERLATLEYLWVDPTDCNFPAEDSVQDSDLVFLPNAAEDSERLAGILERTYEGTLDCPALNGVRDLAEVLAGYREQGTWMPEHWYGLQYKGMDAGALILASHQDAIGAVSNWELVYMGIVPEFRGNGLSQRLVAHAISQAQKQSISRLVLAVDAANQPALHVYQSLGFQAWQRRHVYACLENAT